MGSADFGDKRLSVRLPKLVERLSQAPEKSFPSLLNEGELEGAYRFFANEAVTPDRILAPHVAATVDRVEEARVALAIHDTTMMAFDPDGARVGLGRSRAKGQVFFAHVTLAVAADGTRRPLGALAMRGYVRTDEPGECERDRWLEQMQGVEGRIEGGAPSATIIHVADREADTYPLLATLAVNGSHFVIRMKHNRRLIPDGDAGSTWLREAARADCKVQAKRKVALSVRRPEGRNPIQVRSHPSRAERETDLSIGTTCVFVDRPARLDRGLPEALPLNVVRVWEPNPPAGQEPVEWILLTTEPVGTSEEILKVVDWYRARWTIEELFKALKTGCAYEKRQIETYKGLLKVLAVFLPIAYHLLLLRSLARRSEAVPAHLALTRVQLQVLAAAVESPLPEKPTATDALLAIARLGGHLKRNGDPGWIVLTRGYHTLLTLAHGWRLAKVERSDQS